jgi:hypothetical protein
MRVTAIPAPTARNRLDRSVSSAEERRRQARKMRVRGPIRPDQSVCATTDTAQEEKRLFKGQNQAILTSDRRPLGECRFMSGAVSFFPKATNKHSSYLVASNLSGGRSKFLTWLAMLLRNL